MREPLRAVLASRLFLPEVSAGAFRLGALARGMRRAAADVRVVTTKPPRQAPAAADPEGVRVSRLPVLRDAGGNVRGYVQYLSFDVPLILRLIFRRFDVLVAESPPTTALVAAVVCAVRRRPLAYYAADVWTDGVRAMGAHRVVIGVMRWMESTVLRRAAAVLSVSDEVTERLVLLGARQERVVTVGNGIDTSVFHDGVRPAPAQGEYFVYTGTMSEWQQPDVFIRAFAEIAQEHPVLMLRFFGQGSAEERLRRLADELVPGRVVFGGVVSPQSSAQWLRGATAALVSIVPGIGYDFARPTKTFAAAACGTPVLFAGAESGGRLVRDAELGHAVAYDVPAVADAMRALLRERADGTSDRLRHTRAVWVRENASLEAVGDEAAAAVLAIARSQKRGAIESSTVASHPRSRGDAGSSAP